MTNWADARCIGKTKLFFSEEEFDVVKAKEICSTCPIKRDCTQWALDHKESYGVWGGLDYHELRALALGLGVEPPSRSNGVEHGTERGWAWHRKQRISDPRHQTCEDCRLAYNERALYRMRSYRERLRSKPVI